jgi:hypothetical protein
MNRDAALPEIDIPGNGTARRLKVAAAAPLVKLPAS